jgi:hypothetical protein
MSILKKILVTTIVGGYKTAKFIQETINETIDENFYKPPKPVKPEIPKKSLKEFIKETDEKIKKEDLESIIETIPARLIDDKNIFNEKYEEGANSSYYEKYHFKDRYENFVKYKKCRLDNMPFYYKDIHTDYEKEFKKFENQFTPDKELLEKKDDIVFPDYNYFYKNDLKCNYFYDYYPVNRYGRLESQDKVFDFKSGCYSDINALIISEFLKNNFNDLNNITILPVPASEIAKNNKRYYDLLNNIKKLVPVNSALSSIIFTGKKESKHLTGERTKTFDYITLAPDFTIKFDRKQKIIIL